MNPIYELRSAVRDAALVGDPWKLRCARELRDLSQTDLAVIAGWSPTAGKHAITRIERWHRKFSRARAEALAIAMAMPRDALLSSPAELEASRAQADRYFAHGGNLRDFLLWDYCD